MLSAFLAAFYLQVGESCKSMEPSPLFDVIHVRQHSGRRTGVFHGKVLIIVLLVHTPMVLLLVPVDFCVQFECKSPHLD